ncbi:MAG: GMC family oxidoreductase N-terminal domain-containing protein [Candidatus Aminicenantes bacterium]|nr:GMC family oxidoreductase N-terminal domain-containing protein [Candidatus Aminicenantes bacterium]
MRKAIVVGSGAGGAAVARDLAGAFTVTILEAGGEFRPFGWPLDRAAGLKRLGLLFNEKEIEIIFPAMRVQKTAEGMVLISGRATGGTTTLSCGNALRQDTALKTIGIDLSPEFEELEKDIPVSADHERLWREPTRRLFAVFADMGLDPRPLPKMGRYELCRSCGRCVFGCPHGVKWDSRAFLADARARGAGLMTGCRVEKLLIRSGRAEGIIVKEGRHRLVIPADLVVLAAGGMGTPPLLERSGIPVEPRLFVDPVLCLAAEWKDACQDRELPMPFAAQRNGYILSPYFDHLSFFFNKNWPTPAGNILSLMVKLADSESGRATGTGVDKILTAEDKAGLEEGTALCADILGRMGVPRDRMFFGTLNAGHPGGMIPLTARDASSFHPERLPENVYVADASLFPASLGNPPIWTIMALAKRIAKVCKDLNR